MTYLKLLLISLIIVYIIDISGVVDEFIRPLVIRALKLPKNANLKLKPISCSLCMMFWVGLIYLLAVHAFTIFNIAYVCLLSFLTPNIKGILLYLKELLVFIENKLYKFIDESK